VLQKRNFAEIELDSSNDNGDAFSATTTSKLFVGLIVLEVIAARPAQLPPTYFPLRRISGCS
jgi:hypothetical protein